MIHGLLHRAINLSGAIFHETNLDRVRVILKGNNYPEFFIKRPIELFLENNKNNAIEINLNGQNVDIISNKENEEKNILNSLSSQISHIKSNVVLERQIQNWPFITY